MTPAATVAPILNATSALEGMPTMLPTRPKLAKTEPTPAATATVATIAEKQRVGEPPAEILEALAPDAAEKKTPTEPLATETSSSPGGTITSPDVATVATATDHAPGVAAATTGETVPTVPLPMENPAHTEQINHLLHDAVNHLVGRHDERFVLMASAMAASPTTPLGSELRRNALITLRDLKPRTGLLGLIDRSSSTLAGSTKDILAPTDRPSSAALATFLNQQRNALDADLRDDLLPPQLLTKIRTGELQISDVINHFSSDRKPLLQTVAENLHHEATGNSEGRMPTLYDPREMLRAAGADNLWNRLQIKQMIHPEQFNTKEYLVRYGPIAFIVFMSALQMFPQDQKQAQMTH